MHSLSLYINMYVCISRVDVLQDILGVVLVPRRQGRP